MAILSRVLDQLLVISTVWANHHNRFRFIVRSDHILLFLHTLFLMCVQWQRLYYPLELRSEDEVLVFLVAHEAFHYLRRTKQVEGRHGEIEADGFTLKTLEQYRHRSNTAIPPALRHR